MALGNSPLQPGEGNDCKAKRNTTSQSRVNTQAFQSHSQRADPGGGRQKGEFHGRETGEGKNVNRASDTTWQKAVGRGEGLDFSPRLVSQRRRLALSLSLALSLLRTYAKCCSSHTFVDISWLAFCNAAGLSSSKLGTKRGHGRQSFYFSSWRRLP